MRNKTVLGAILILLVIAVTSAAVYFFFLKDDDSDSSTNEEQETSIDDNDSLRIDLNSQSVINQYGTAILEEQEGKLSVELSLVNNPDTLQPVHIHVGSCEAPGAIIVNLTNVVNGRSTSLVDLNLDDINDGNHIITGHRSAEDLGTYDFCGVIK